MSTLSAKSIFPSFVLSVGGTIFGWVLTEKLADSEAGYSFLYFGAGVATTILTLQIVFCLLGRHRVLHQLLFAIAFGFSLVWFMLCFVLPLLWAGTISDASKLLLLTFLILLSIFNVATAFKQFNRKWAALGESAFAQNYHMSASSIDWQRVIQPLKLTTELYIPGMPKRAIPLISVALIISMLVGLNLRKMFPVFSAFAWGIPSCLVISIFVQMMGLGLAQVVKITGLEKEIGKKIRPKTIAK